MKFNYLNSFVFGKKIIYKYNEYVNRNYHTKMKKD